VALAHRRDPVGVVLLGVVLRADPEVAAVEQPRRAGERALARHPLRAQVAPDAPAHLRQRAREDDHRVELLLVAARAPERVVEVLLTPGGVDAGGLDVAERIGADPDVLPRRRDRELADPLQHARLGDPAPVLLAVLEAAPAATADDPRA
jgi:hypothetical protein